MSKNLLSSIGTITKDEEITTADHINGANIMIFETQHPYYGYYGTTVPENPDTTSLFLVTRLQHNDEKIIRSIQAVKKKINYKFDAVPGHISFNNKLYGVIRVRCVAEKNIPELVKLLSETGIEFIAPRKQAPVVALIHITKYFDIEEVEDGIFFDLNNETFGYLRVESKLDWDKFVSVTKHVRNNVVGITFDGAQSTLYNRDGVIDFVRVYSEKRSVDDLRVIRNRYLDSM